MSESVIADFPPRDGREWDCQCARCGSSCDSTGCECCGNDGWVEGLDEYEDHYETCSYCNGRPVRYHCMSSPEWCEANPVEGRGGVKRGAIEWFVVAEGGAS